MVRAVIQQWLFDDPLSNQTWSNEETAATRRITFRSVRSTVAQIKDFFYRRKLNLKASPTTSGLSCKIYAKENRQDEGNEGSVQALMP